ncbi:hypothetical protein [Streptomyces sp. NPDC001450]
MEGEPCRDRPLTVVVGGAVITGRLAPEAVWKERVAIKDVSAWTASELSYFDRWDAVPAP